MHRVSRFSDVEVVDDVGTALLCSVGDRRVWVPVLEIRYGTEVSKTGDRGSLIIPRRVAQQIGLVVAAVTPTTSD